VEHGLIRIELREVELRVGCEILAAAQRLESSYAARTMSTFSRDMALLDMRAGPEPATRLGWRHPQPKYLPEARRRWAAECAELQTDRYLDGYRVEILEMSAQL
jgi:hypothetical protein